MNSNKLSFSDFTEEPSLPEILQADWEREQVLQLFDDLRDGAEVEHVQLRKKSSDAAATLAEAKRAFADGEAQAIQIRYRFENEAWCDTLMPAAPTTRIIRNRVPV